MDHYSKHITPKLSGAPLAARQLQRRVGADGGSRKKERLWMVD